MFLNTIISLKQKIKQPTNFLARNKTKIKLNKFVNLKPHITTKIEALFL